jgi:hypothetical protein
MTAWFRDTQDSLTAAYDPHRPAGRRALAALIVGCLMVAGFVVFAQPWRAVALIGVAAAAYFSFRRPEAVLLVLAAYTPFEPFLLKFVPDEIYLYARYFSEGLIYLLLAVAAARKIARRERPTPTPLDLPFVGLIVVALASLAVNAVPAVYGILGLRQIIRFILLFFAAVNLDLDARFTKRLVVVMIGVMAFEAALGLVQAGTHGALDSFLIPSERRFFESIQLTSGTTQFWSPGTRIFATMGRYDQLGTFLSFFMALALGLYYVHRGERTGRRYGWLVVLAAPALLLTMSRASWFGFLLAFGFIGAWVMKDFRVRFAFAAAVISAVIYLGWSGLSVRYLTDYPQQTAVERLFESFSYERWRGEYYGLGRLYWMVQTPLVVVRSSPVLGVGPGQYGGGAVAALGNTAVYDRLNLPFGVYGTDGYIDNSWFAVWGELGTLGLFFYGWMVYALAMIGWRAYRFAKDNFLRGLGLGYVGACLAVTFQAFLATYLEVRTLALYLWLMGAVIYLWGKKEKVFG